MSNNGLNISEDEFCRMSAKDRDLCLYKNQVKTLELVKGYKFYYRLVTLIGAFVLSALGFIYYYTFILN